MSSISDLRARLAAAQEKQKSFGKTQDKSLYPFWNIPEGSHSTIRFLPNGASNSNGDFWVEKLMIKLPFAGVRGKNTNKTIVQVPCVQMFGDKCPIQEEIKPLWKTDEATAKIYYKKKSFILQGFVRANSIPDDVTPENPVRRFNVTSKLMALITAGLMDPEMEDMPTDFIKGTDFHIYKTKPGEWADYSTSRWARKASSLTEEEAAVLEAHPLADLASYLPKKPDEQTLAVIMEMFIDSMNGEPYDLEKYGKFYKPKSYGLDDEGETKATAGSGSHTTVSAASEEVAEETVEETVAETVAAPVKTVASAVKATVAAPAPGKQSVQQLLAQLKANQKK